MKRSTALRNFMLADGSFRTAVDGLVIKLFSGPEPTSADAPLSGNTLLCTITVDGDGSTGLTLDTTATGGQIVKNPSEVWEGTVTTTGVATFFRMETLADSGASSTSAIRLQGTVGLIDQDLILSSTALVAGDLRRINFFVAAIPAA